MKFFSDLRSCYRPGAGVGDDPASTLQEEDARAPLSRGGVGSAGRRRRSPGGRSRAEAGGHWRPALSVISEDNDAAAVAAAVVRAAGAAKSRERGANAVKRPPPSKGGTAAKRAQSFGDREDYRPSPLSMFVPAFSPTPFMI
ncbi:hypothetical protein ACJRO7_006661 [Eucalyptus globulus]|uniref:Uncharacterized protein n=1 Tax=Eucalyptus globulus TaxID=34317 RepID=A0ABD3IJC4_EUCGL